METYVSIKSLNILEDLSVNEFSYFYNDVYMDTDLLVNGDASFESDVEISHNLLVHDNVFIDQALNVYEKSYFSDDVSMSKHLLVLGDASFETDVEISHNLIVHDSVYIDDSLNVYEKSYFSDDVSMTKNLHVHDSVYVDNSLNIYEKSYFSDDVSMSKHLLVLGDASFETDVEISHNLIVHDSVYIDDSLNVYEKSYFSDDVSMSKHLLVLGDASFETDLEISHNLIVHDSVYIDDSLNVYEKSYFSDDVSMSKHLLVLGDASFETNVDISDDLHISGNLEVDSHTEMNSLDLIGHLEAYNTSKFTMDASFLSNVYVDDDLVVNESLKVNTTSSFVGDVSMNNNLHVTKTLVVEDDTSLNSNLLVVKTATFDDHVTMNQDVSMNTNLEVANNLIIHNDVSLNNFVDISNTLTINKDTGNALVVHGDVSFNKNLNMYGTFTNYGLNNTIKNNLIIGDSNNLDQNDDSLFVHYQGEDNGDDNLKSYGIKVEKYNAALSDSQNRTPSIRLTNSGINSSNEETYVDFQINNHSNILDSKTGVYAPKLHFVIGNKHESDSSSEIENNTMTITQINNESNTSHNSNNVMTAIGIDNENPLYSLDVSGNLRVKNDFRFESDGDISGHLKVHTDISCSQYVSDVSFTENVHFSDSSKHIEVDGDISFNNNIQLSNSTFTFENSSLVINNNDTDFDITTQQIKCTVIEADEFKQTGNVTQTFNTLNVLPQYTQDNDGNYTTDVSAVGVAYFEADVSFATNLQAYGNVVIGTDYNHSQQITDTIDETTFNMTASQSNGRGIYYDGDITIGHPSHSNDDISGGNGRQLTVYGDLRIKDGGNLVIEDIENSTITQLQTEIKVTDILQISNDATGPSLVVNQTETTTHDIAHFQDDSLNVVVIGADGNTGIAGKLKVNIGTMENGISDDFSFNGISKDDHAYHLTISGDAYISNDLDVKNNIYLDNKFQQNTIENKTIFQIGDINSDYDVRTFDENVLLITNQTPSIDTNGDANESVPIMYLGRVGKYSGQNPIFNSYSNFSIARYHDESEINDPRTRFEINLDDTYNDLNTSIETKNVFTLLSEGKMGINNNAPSYELDVSGSSRITENLYVYNDTSMVDVSAQNIETTQNITVHGNTYLQDASAQNVDLAENLDVQGNTTLVDVSMNDLTINRVISDIEILGHTHAQDISLNNMDIEENVSIVGTLDVSGNSDLSYVNVNFLDCNYDIDITRNLTVHDSSVLQDLSAQNIESSGNIIINTGYLHVANDTNQYAKIGKLKLGKNDQLGSNHVALMYDAGSLGDESFMIAQDENGKSIINRESSQRVEFRIGNESTDASMIIINASNHMGILCDPTYTFDVSGIANIRDNLLAQKDMYFEDQTASLWIHGNESSTDHFYLSYTGSNAVIDTNEELSIEISESPKLSVMSDNTTVKNKLIVDQSSNFLNDIDVSGNILVRDFVRMDFDNDLNFRIREISDNDIEFYTQDIKRVVIRSDGDVDICNNVHLEKDININGTMTSSSDQRIKTNIKQLEGCLDNIMNINGYSYNRTDLLDLGKTHLGVIAQNIEEYYPDIVHEDHGTNIKQVNYNGLIPILIESIKELKRENDQLKNKIDIIMAELGI